MILGSLLGAQGDEHLADVHPGRRAVGLAEGAAHAAREAIGARAAQRLVDAQHVEGVGADADVEEVLKRTKSHFDQGSLRNIINIKYIRIYIYMDIIWIYDDIYNSTCNMYL